MLGSPERCLFTLLLYAAGCWGLVYSLVHIGHKVCCVGFSSSWGDQAIAPTQRPPPIAPLQTDGVQSAPFGSLSTAMAPPAVPRSRRCRAGTLHRNTCLLQEPHNKSKGPLQVCGGTGKHTVQCAHLSPMLRPVSCRRVAWAACCAGTQTRHPPAPRMLKKLGPVGTWAPGFMHPTKDLQACIVLLDRPLARGAGTPGAQSLCVHVPPPSAPSRPSPGRQGSEPAPCGPVEGQGALWQGQTTMEAGLQAQLGVRAGAPLQTTRAACSTTQPLWH